MGVPGRSGLPGSARSSPGTQITVTPRGYQAPMSDAMVWPMIALIESASKLASPSMKSRGRASQFGMRPVRAEQDVTGVDDLG
jgi:hypothetical protein